MLNNSSASLSDLNPPQAEIPVGWFSQYIVNPVSSTFGFLLSNISDVENSYAFSQYVKSHFKETALIDLDNVRAQLLDPAKAQDMKQFVERMQISLNTFELSDTQKALFQRLKTATLEDLQALNDEDQLILARLKNRLEKAVVDHNILNTQYSYIEKVAKLNGIRTMALLSPLSVAYQNSVQGFSNVIRYNHQGRSIHAQEAFYNGAFTVLPSLLAAGALTTIETLAPSFVTCLGGYPSMVVGGLVTVAVATNMHKKVFDPKKSLFQQRDEKIESFKNNLQKGTFNKALAQSELIQEEDHINVFDLELMALVQDSDPKTVQAEYTTLLKSGLRASISKQGSKNDSLSGYTERLFTLGLLKQKEIDETCRAVLDSIQSKIEEFNIRFDTDTFATRRNLLKEIDLFIEQHPAAEWTDPVLKLMEENQLIQIRDLNRVLLNIENFDKNYLDSLFDYFTKGFQSDQQKDFIEEAQYTLHCLDQNTPSEKRDDFESAFVSFLAKNLPLEALSQLCDRTLQPDLSINTLAYENLSSNILSKALDKGDTNQAYSALKALKNSEILLTLGLKSLQVQPDVLQRIRLLASSEGEGILCSNLDKFSKQALNKDKSLTEESTSVVVVAKNPNKKHW